MSMPPNGVDSAIMIGRSIRRKSKKRNNDDATKGQELAECKKSFDWNRQREARRKCIPSCDLQQSSRHFLRVSASLQKTIIQMSHLPMDKILKLLSCQIKKKDESRK